MTNWNQYATEQACTTRSSLAVHRARHADNDNYPRIVGLMGNGGAGKTEAKKFLVDHKGFWGEHIKTPLANMVGSLLRDAGIKDDDIPRFIDGDLKRTPIVQLGGRTCTEIQQFQGTEFGREYCDDDLWLNLWATKANTALSEGFGVVQESVRFHNEAAWIRRNGGVIIEITRPGCGPINGHKSEVRPAIADAVVPNTGSIAQLHALLDETLSGWRDAA